ncbi:autophagy-related protein 17 [Lipomyces oligophaga]|uniref:autophagy-related protein 17 n=1 Tax=Lipomyces oligophaga TaxID=45792 RepID=UPI0034CDA7ED
MEADWYAAAHAALASAQPICVSADALVAGSRSALESALAVHARTLFLSRELGSQLALLYQISDALHANATTFEAEFDASLLELDESGSKLDSVLGRLQDTVVDPAFRSTQSQSIEGQKDGLTEDNSIVSPQTLKNYTDDAGVEELKQQLRQAIDLFQTAHADMSQDLGKFDASLTELADQCGGGLTSMDLPTSSDVSIQVSTLADSEAVALHLGSILESLAHHYDQCSQAVEFLTQPLDNALSDEEYEDRKREREDLIEVLQADSAQVDEVVRELQTRFSVMVSGAVTIKTFFNTVTQNYAVVCKNSKAIFNYRDSLDGHIQSMRKFSNAVSDYFTRRNSLLSELEQLADYFEIFLQSYDALVLEVVRRKTSQALMEKVVEQALDKLKDIYENELAARQKFYSSQGPYIPADLWPGVADPPTGFEIIAHEVSPLPDLRPSLVEEVKNRFLSNRR